MSALSSRTSELAESRRLARLRTISCYVTGLVHDFNNALGGIVAYVDERRRRLDPSSPEGLEVGRLDESLERSMNLLRTVTRFAIESSPNARKTRLSELVTDLHQLVRSSWTRRGLGFVIETRCDATVRVRAPETLALLLRLAERAVAGATPDAPGVLTVVVELRSHDDRSWGVVELSCPGDPSLDLALARFTTGGGSSDPSGELAGDVRPATLAAVDAAPEIDAALAVAALEHALSGGSMLVSTEGDARRMALLLPLAPEV